MSEIRVDNITDEAGTGAPEIVDHYKKSNILGTVSESGGVPTGAIIESDSDSRGEWTRWADGTQAVVCFPKNGSATSTRSSGVSTSLSASVASFSYPRNFTSTPSVSPHLLSGTGQSTANLCAVRPTDSTGSVDISIMSLDGVTDVQLPCVVGAFGRFF